MGVQGLTSILEAGARPRVVTLGEGEAAARPDNLLLIDASAVQYYLISQLGDSVDWKTTDFHAPLYAEACRYYGGLTRTGLRCVLIADSAPGPGYEATYTERRRLALASGRFMPPTTEPVLFQAYADLGLEVVRSTHSADALLLAWALRHSASLFALLTTDSDFYVYGVPRVVHVSEVVVDPRSVTFHTWHTDELWRGWHAAATGSPSLPSLVVRAQVAAVLGNDVSKDLRRRLTTRRRVAAAAGLLSSSGGARATPSSVARAVVQYHYRGGGALGLDFFRGPPLSLRSYDEDDLAVFNAVVQGYVADDAAARSGTALRDLTLTAESLPWLQPAVAARLAGAAAAAAGPAPVPAPVPALVPALACRGFGALTAPPPHWAALQPLRRRVAAALLGDAAPGQSYEYDPHANVVHALTAAPAAADGAANGPGAAGLERRRSQWFSPDRDLPGVQVAAPASAAAAPAAPPLQRRATPAETAAAVAEAYPGLPSTLAVYVALLLHLVDPEEDAWRPDAVRELLLPGVPVLVGANAPVAAAAVAAAAVTAAAAEQEEMAVAAAARGAGGAPSVIDVGSALSTEDWNDIDAKEVVGKVRASAGFNMLKRIRPWAPPSGPRNGGGGGAAAAAAGGDGAAGLVAAARAAAAAGPDSPEWAAAQRAWSAARPRAREQALGDMWGSANRWLSSAPGGGPMRHLHQQEVLDLVDGHLRADARARLRRPLHVILSTPTGSGKTFTAVMLQLHVLKGVRAAEAAAGGAAAAVPRARGGGGGGGAVDAESALAVEGRPGHPAAILVYSVPTKQVLKRVGQECEAHGVVYWTAAQDGELFQVRRPYSIRTKRGGDGGGGAGPMARQLEECSERGSRNDDLGGGKPDVIIADIASTAALVRAAREAPPDSFYHSANLVLYLDEPNMGIHLDAHVRSVVRTIMTHAPPTTILASATLPAWDDLPAWWKGADSPYGVPPTAHVVISQEPYELPLCRLSVHDAVSGQLVSVSPLELFDDAAQLAAHLEGGVRGRVLLLRHFTPEQANELLDIRANREADEAAGRGAAAAGPAEEDGWRVLEQDVRGLRSELLEPELLRLAAEAAEEEEEAGEDAEGPEGRGPGGGGGGGRFEAQRERWRQRPQPAAGLADVLSKTGVSLVATLRPRAVALQLAGRESDPARWADDARALRQKIRDAAAAKRAADKARERAAKRGAGPDDDGRGGGDGGLSGAGRVALRPGLEVWADEADEVEDTDTLVMLSKGVAYAASKGVEPLVKRLYQQALLYVPERAGVRPPLHTLVVDYSAVYGTDCPGVDTIVLCPDLGELLSAEDHTQFLGRLRRDGTAVYPSMELLRRAVLGGGVRQWDERRRRREERQRAAVEAVLTPYVAPPAAGGAAADATAAVTQELLRLVRPGSFSRSDVACAVLAAALRDVVCPAAPLAGDDAAAAAAAEAMASAGERELLAAALKRLQRWGRLRPVGLLEALFRRPEARPAEQRRLVDTLAQLCTAAPPEAARDGSSPPSSSTARLLPFAARLLQELANEDLVELEALTAWCKEAEGRGAGPGPARAAAAAAEGQGDGAEARAQAFRVAAVRIRDWLAENESSEEGEEGSEDE